MGIAKDRAFHTEEIRKIYEKTGNLLKGVLMMIYLYQNLHFTHLIKEDVSEVSLLVIKN